MQSGKHGSTWWRPPRPAVNTALALSHSISISLSLFYFFPPRSSFSSSSLLLTPPSSSFLLLLLRGDIQRIGVQPGVPPAATACGAPVSLSSGGRLGREGRQGGRERETGGERRRAVTCAAAAPPASRLKASHGCPAAQQQLELAR